VSPRPECQSELASQLFDSSHVRVVRARCKNNPHLGGPRLASFRSPSNKLAPVRVLRIYHAGRDSGHRARERALVGAGVDLTLAVPRRWPGGETVISDEPFRMVELDVRRAGDVNRHSYARAAEIRRLIYELGPDVVDVHEEPFSLAARQVLAVTPPAVPVVMYTAQNVDKRLPPPFSFYERQAHRRVSALYPCSRQAAAVARGKGFDGAIHVIPLGFDPKLFRVGQQSLDDDILTFALVGRLVPEKGVVDAVHVLAKIQATRPARLVLVGAGPEEHRAQQLAEQLGLGDRLESVPWASPADVAGTCRRAHIVLVPSMPTETWTEQFGRVIVEAQASGAVVAGYDTGSIAEVGGAAAVLVKGGDVSALADAVSGLVQDPGEYEMRRERGLQSSATRTWHEVAARQVELYELVATGSECLQLPASPRLRREAARAEFGPTAPTMAGIRPFALPVLRRGGRFASGAGRMIDAIAESKARGQRG
jgi:glycosyltransferase involved in cell wall biosynthesis